MSGAGETVNPMPSSNTLPETTQGTLLGGRVVYRQFRQGYRTGIEPVLLAALIPAREGDYVLEGGCGAGAGLLCLNARVGGLRGIGLEADPATVTLARVNFALNDVAGLLDALPARLPALPDGLRTHAPMPNGRFHHSFANPPWHRADFTPSPESRRRLALSAPTEGWTSWIATLARWTAPGGTLSLALPAAATEDALPALGAAGCGSIVLFPLWPKQGVPARLVLLRATIGGRGAFRLASGLVLHETDGSFTAEAQAILRDGRSIML
ncbi:tRNA1(Val) (adenine(37)-N6)-methyltransferase [Acidomonas methanolica]|uniref:Methyltransferase n=1 Tax=Acidomonas methanolica NBRC 104435 TaxID=1231351 RepID=A0A023D4N4_ACIMT|nr:SAM-dependent methyltransferase [Acidomonas methanolica]MBU2653595.1 SAM-dependent methyltransferase [Acidomonas methanolica]TCS31546.1 tRNA1(Val) A37 N6-methylase TrmN6 [Acidomonas methanolica]GAJ28761.1 methyltransferase [Acidomonas methanolica NBRC 104435]GBQ55808.1 methyltransferase [Acidomonas methanolica]GEK97965.1 hypothetical protein AME01nite_04640 [Acidomonas methanolica NBRC 104435]